MAWLEAEMLFECRADLLGRLVGEAECVWEGLC